MPIHQRHLLSLVTIGVLSAVIGCGPNGQHRVSIRRASPAMNAAAKSKAPGAPAKTTGPTAQTPAKPGPSPTINVPQSQVDTQKKLDQLETDEKAIVGVVPPIHDTDMIEGTYKLQSVSLKFAYLATDGHKAEALDTYSVNLTDDNGKVTADPTLQKEKSEVAGLMNDADVPRKFDIPLEFQVKKDAKGQWVPNRADSSNGLLSMQFLPSLQSSQIQTSLNLEDANAPAMKASVYSLIMAGQTDKDENGNSLQLRIFQLSANQLLFVISADEDPATNNSIAHRYHSAYLIYSITPDASKSTPAK